MQSAIDSKVVSFKELKDSIKRAIWPSGEAENLVHAHDAMFIEGLAEIQKWVQGEATVNCTVTRFNRTYHKGGMTVVPAPKGVVTRVYTVADDNWLHPVFFSPRAWPDPEDWAKRLRGRYLPLHRGDNKLPVGFQYAEPWHDLRHGWWGEADKDTACPQSHDRFERAKHGIYSIHDRNIYMAPWIQSNEMVVVEWHGIKTAHEWSDDDLISDAVDFRLALKLYVQYAHERDFGDMETAELFHNSAGEGHYDTALADLMWQAREENRLRSNKIPAPHEHVGLIDTLLLNKAARQLGLTKPEEHHHRRHEWKEDEEFIFGHIGNNGCGTPNADAVACMVKGWHPRFIVASGGDCIAGPGVFYDFTVGREWHDFIWPYNGQYGNGSSENRFWPAVDDNDWNNQNWKLFAEFFALYTKGHFYDVSYGPLHLFFISGVNDEPAGNAADSQQGRWLQTALMLSTARWKVVVVAAPPFSSDNSTQKSNMQWPFDQWGADAVFAGTSEDYERFSVNRFTYIVNGLGGAGLLNQSSTALNSIKFYAGNYGAGKVTVSRNRLRYECLAIDGTVVDNFEITKGTSV